MGEDSKLTIIVTSIVCFFVWATFATTFGVSYWRDIRGDVTPKTLLVDAGAKD